jgi:hypothetical protein
VGVERDARRGGGFARDGVPVGVETDDAGIGGGKLRQQRRVREQDGRVRILSMKASLSAG